MFSVSSSSFVLVLVLGARRFRIEDEDEGGSPLSWTSASTYPGSEDDSQGHPTFDFFAPLFITP
jgi:hypothetical protein